MEPLYIHFIGSIEHQGVSYCVRFRTGNQNLAPYKSFSKRQYGSLTEAYKAALEHQQVTSDSMGLSTWIYPSELQLDFKQWFAAFIDGDGTIGLCDKKYPTISAAQSQENGIPEILKIIQSKYGGWIRKKKRMSDKHRIAYEWCLVGAPALVAIYDVAQCGHLKKSQAQQIINHVKKTNSLNCSSLFKEQEKLHSLEWYQTQIINKCDITLPTVAGLFSAEGCILIQGMSSLILDIAQKSSPNYLRAINFIFHNVGSIERDQELIFFGQHAANVMEQILPYVIGPKRKQILLALEAHKLGSIGDIHRRPESLRNRLRDIREQITALKYI